MKYDFFGTVVWLLVFLIGLVVILTLIILGVLLAKTLMKSLRSGSSRKKESTIRKSLGDILKQHREERKMTQEFVAESVGVSRQAVSKWENGLSDPSTSNLMALAKCFEISVEELLHETE